MKQEHFTQKYSPQWERMARYLANRKEPDPSGEFPRLYRQICQHLALARRRGYSMRLVEQLNGLVLQGHQRLYSTEMGRRHWLRHFLVRDLPRGVRREKRLIAVSSLLFFGPLFALLVGVQWQPDLVYAVLDPVNVQGVEAMYEPDTERIGRERGSDSDLLMFAFYVYNNTGIGFRTFASGLLFGLGTILALVFNGLVIGSLAGHLTRVGYGETFWPFVAGHSALELTAIVLSGAAGLRLGLALLTPGRHSRLQAIRLASAGGIHIVAGAALMFFLAAFVEAFWSSIAWIAPWIKYSVGAAMWLIVVGYFLLMGRSDGT